jgi:hypothetical protein
MFQAPGNPPLRSLISTLYVGKDTNHKKKTPISIALRTSSVTSRPRKKKEDIKRKKFSTQLPATTKSTSATKSTNHPKWSKAAAFAATTHTSTKANLYSWYVDRHEPETFPSKTITNWTDTNASNPGNLPLPLVQKDLWPQRQHLRRRNERSGQ